MFTGTVVSSGAKAFWFAEQDESRNQVFIHISQVQGQRYLHIGDRIKFEIAPNPRKPETVWATNVEIIEPGTSEQGVRP